MWISKLILIVVLLTTFNSGFADDHTKSNLDIIRSAYSPPADNLFNVMAADIEWIEMAGSPYGGVFVGAEAIGANVFSNLGKDWEGFHPEPDQFIDGGDKIIVTGVYKGMYKATGKTVAARFAHIYLLQNGKIVKFEQFTDTQLLQKAMSP